MRKPFIFKEIDFLFYRFRHIIIYTFIGFFSIICELIIRYALIQINISILLSSLIGLFCGILFASILNINFNFFIKKNFLFKALVYYFLISIFSVSLQFVITQFTKIQPIIPVMLSYSYDYELNRLIIAGSIFILAYLLHKKYSFKNSAKLGVAIYASNEINVHSIFQKIGVYPDFIHVDIVDETFIKHPKKKDFSQYGLIKNCWKDHDIHTHLMTKKPSKIIDKVGNFSDIIFFHYEIEENINETIQLISDFNCEPGIVLHAVNNYRDRLEKITEKFSNIMVLSIPLAGYSGQIFYKKSYDLIRDINELQKTRKLNLFVDGGINKENIKYINAENVISGSYVLKSTNPRQEIMRLKAFGKYI